MTTSIYVASRYTRNAEMHGVRDVLHALGYTVTSRWIDPTIVKVRSELARETPEERLPRP